MNFLGLTGHSLCRSWCPQGWPLTREGNLFSCLSFSSWEAAIRTQHQHKPTSGVDVNESSNYWAGCEEFLGAQSEQLNADLAAGCGVCTHSQHISLFDKLQHWAVPASDTLELIMGAAKWAPGSHLLSRLKNLRQNEGNGRDLCTNFVPSAPPKQIRALAPCLQGSFTLLFQSSFELVSIVELFEEGSKTLSFIPKKIKLYIKLFSTKNSA